MLVPIGEALAFNGKLVAREGFGEDIGPHECGGTTDYGDAAIVYFFFYPEVPDVDVATAFGAWTSVVDE